MAAPQIAAPIDFQTKLETAPGSFEKLFSCTRVWDDFVPDISKLLLKTLPDIFFSVEKAQNFTGI